MIYFRKNALTSKQLEGLGWKTKVNMGEFFDWSNSKYIDKRSFAKKWFNFTKQIAQPIPVTKPHVKPIQPSDNNAPKLKSILT